MKPHILDLHFILGPETLPVHFPHLERLQIHPVNGAHIDGQFPIHLFHAADGPFELVDQGDAAGGAEGVAGYFAGELVEGQGRTVVDRYGFLGRVDPEVGVLGFIFGFGFCF